MSKLTVTQAQYVIRRLRAFTMDTIQQLDPQIREACVPPQLSDKELKKYLLKLAYDDPKGLVSMILRGDEWLPKTKRLQERNEGFTQYHEAMGILRSTAESLLQVIEGDLLFKEDWDKNEYPLYLEDDILSDLMEVLQDDKETTVD